MTMLVTWEAPQNCSCSEELSTFPKVITTAQNIPRPVQEENPLGSPAPQGRLQPSSGGVREVLTIRTHQSDLCLKFGRSFLDVGEVWQVFTALATEFLC